MIDWVAKAGMGKIFENDPRINHIFNLKMRKMPFYLNPAKLKIIFSSLFNPYDHIINLELGSLFNDIVRFTRARNKVGMPYRHFTEPAETHAVENLHLIYASFLNKEDMALAQPSLMGSNFFELRKKFSLEDKFIVLSPSNSHHNKKSSLNLRAWPVEHWKTLFALLQKNDVNAVMVGAASEQTYFDKLEPLPSNITSLVGKTTFPELISLIQGAEGLVVTDTGTAHIAAAVDASVYALIGPTNYKRTGPYQTKSNQVTILKSNVACSPCYHTDKMHMCKDNICMTKITPNEVLASILAKE